MAFTLITPLKRAFPALARLDRQIDGGTSFGGRPLIGPSRNYFGLAFAVVIALVWGLLAHSGLIALEVMLTFAGTLLGSFVKRRLDYPQGEAFPVIDQADYLIVVGLVWFAFGLARPSVILIAFVLTLIGHPVISYVAFKIGLKDQPY